MTGMLSFSINFKKIVTCGHYNDSTIIYNLVQLITTLICGQQYDKLVLYEIEEHKNYKIYDKVRYETKKLGSIIMYITCEPHSDHEDTSIRSKSVLCKQRLENPSSDTYDIDLKVTLQLQAQGRYKVCFHPGAIIL